MATTVFETPSESVESKLEEGLAYRAVKSGNNWILPSGKNAANGDPVVFDGRFGYATAAIVGGTDAIVEDTNWKPYGDGGALGALNSNLKWKYLGNKTGLGASNAIEYPENADELLIDLPWDNARGWRQTINIKCLDESGIYGNIPASGYSVSVYVNASNRNVYVAAVNTPNGAFGSTNAKFYYR